ncbi:MAG: type I addiction module toxin, SymE family [Bacteroidetes bacterium]|nr:type I addiction module toxin, SymE family [Bacteroidota bacterium]
MKNNKPLSSVQEPKDSRVQIVSYRYYPSDTDPHPFIRIGGKYLEEYGFSIGDRIEVCLSPEQITLTKVKVPNSKPEG